MVEELHTPTLEVGSLLAGRYRVGAMLGAGGMATVHRAHDEVLGRDVAIKVLGHDGEDPVARGRERAEIDMLAGLSHRALVTVFDAATIHLAGGMSTVIVMELVDGPTLAARRRQGPIADADLARLAVDIAEALVVVHARGIVHRDVKPSNILLAPSPLAGREFDARLADFGIATLEGGSRLTATGAVLGTAAYLSPEQAMGQEVTTAADVYSFGLVLLEAVTGTREFPGPVLEALTARMLRDPVIPDAMHPRWASLLAAMTAREVADRPTPELVLELASGLAADRVPPLGDGAGQTLPMRTPAADPAPVPASAAAPTTVLATEAPAHPSKRRSRRLVVGLAAAAAIATGVTVAAFALQPTTSPTPPAEVADVSDPPAAPSPTAPTVVDPVVPPAVPASVAPVDAPAVDPGTGDDTTLDGGSNGGNGSGNGGSGNGGGNGGGSNNGGGNGNGNGGSGNGNGNG